MKWRNIRLKPACRRRRTKKKVRYGKRYFRAFYLLTEHEFWKFFGLCGSIFLKKSFFLLPAQTSILGLSLKAGFSFWEREGGPFIGSDSGVLFDSGPFLFFLRPPPPADELCPFSKTIYFALYFLQEMSFFGGGAKFARGEKRTSQDPTLFPSLYLPYLKNALEAIGLATQILNFVRPDLTENHFPLCSPPEKNLLCERHSGFFIGKKYL